MSGFPKRGSQLEGLSTLAEIEHGWFKKWAQEIAAVLLACFVLVSAVRAEAAESPSGRALAMAAARGTDSPRNGVTGSSVLDVPTPVYWTYVDQGNGRGIAELLELASQQNRELAAARQNLLVLKGRLRQARLLPNPVIDALITTDRMLGGVGEYQLYSSLYQRIELFGKRRKRMTAADLELERGRRLVEFQEQQLRAQVESQYAEALAAVEALRLSERLLGLNEKLLSVARGRFDQGDIAKLDLNLIEVEVNRFRLQRLQAENRIKSVLLQLKTLVGFDPDFVLKLRVGDAPRTVRDKNLPGEFVTKALQNRPDLLAAQIAERVAAARWKLSKAEAFPDVTVMMRYLQDKFAFPDTPVGSLTDVSKQLGFGLSIPIPIFNRNQGNIDETAAVRIQTRQSKDYLENVVKRDVELALNRLEIAGQAVSLYDSEILSRSRENVEIIRKAYDLGNQQMLDLVAEQRRLIEAEQQRIEAEKEYYLAVIELERAVGMRLR